MAVLLDGRVIAAHIMEELRKRIAALPVQPTLAAILIGDDESSHVYVAYKEKACAEVGICSKKELLPATVSESELLAHIEALNNQQDIHGILVQLPLPSHISEERVLEAINPLKDVDGFHPLNAGRLSIGNAALLPCTPKGIIRLLQAYDIQLKGKNVVIVGASNIVGKPLAMLCLQEGATPLVVCHSKTVDLSALTLLGDILVSAVGKPGLITASMVKQGAVVVDIGITRREGKLYGDVDFENVKEVASAITPVPGGVGPMTVAMLLENTVLAYEMQKVKGERS